MGQSEDAAADGLKGGAAAGNLLALAQRYWLLLELSPDAIAVHEMGTVVWVNSAAVRFAEVKSRSQILGMQITEFVHPDSRAAMVERLLAMGEQAGASTGPDEVTMCTSAGRPVPMEVTSVRTLWEGRPAYQVILRDIRPAKAADAALRYQAALVDHVSDAVIGLDTRGIVRSWNPAASTMYGATAGQAVGHPVADVVGAEIDPGAVIALGGSTDAMHHRRDGAELSVRVTASAMDAGYLVVCANDTSHRMLLDRLGSILAALSEAVMVVTGGGVIDMANPAALALLSIPPDAVPGITITTLPLEFDHTGATEGGAVAALFATAIASGPGFIDRTVYLNNNSEDTHRWLSCSCTPLYLDGAQPAVLVSLTDITDRHLTAARHHYEATHDTLTGLVNRAGILAHLDNRHTPDACQRSDIVVYYLDLNNFKLINDSMGHIVGDTVLQAVARRLLSEVGSGAVVGRLGGDEFVIIDVASDDPEEQARQQADRIHAALTEPIHVRGRDEQISTSIGVTLVGHNDHRSSTDILRDADVALYRAKASPEPFVLFSVELRRHLQRRAFLESDLRIALASPGPPGLHMVYQPVFDVRTVQPVAAEALIRWDHPTLGPVGPDEFIPLSEESDLITPIGEFAIQRAIADFAAADWTHGVLCVNVSRRDLIDTTIVDRIDTVLGQTGFDPTHLCLEVTESAVTNVPRTTRHVLKLLRQRGIKIAIDDFGTGSSSLSQLYRLPLDIIKIARPFIADLATSAAARTITAGIIGMSHATDLIVVAEGIETADQLAAITDLDCDLAQGFYLRRPSPLRSLQTLYRTAPPPSERTQ